MQGRYHGAGFAPRGGYLFASVTRMKADFDSAMGSNAIVTKKDTITHPEFGAGYQTTRGTAPVSLDMGIGLGPSQTLEVETANEKDTVKIAGTLYVGFALNFQ